MRRTDAGSGPVTAILVVAILALLVGAGFAASGAAAGDEAASANHAADAAALGGAQGVLDNLPASLNPGFEDVDDIADLLGGGTCVQAGRAKAAQLAAANGATLTSYCWNVFADRVTASVRMNRTNVAGPPTSADAEAASTFDASACTLDPQLRQTDTLPVADSHVEPFPNDVTNVNAGSDQDLGRLWLRAARRPLQRRPLPLRACRSHRRRSGAAVDGLIGRAQLLRCSRIALQGRRRRHRSRGRTSLPPPLSGARSPTLAANWSG